VGGLSGVVLARFWVDAVVKFVRATKQGQLWTPIDLGIFA